MRNVKAALARWRKDQGLDPAECAKRLGVSLRSYQRWESRRKQMIHGTMKVVPVPPWLVRMIDRKLILKPVEE